MTLCAKSHNMKTLVQLFFMSALLSCFSCCLVIARWSFLRLMAVVQFAARLIGFSRSLRSLSFWRTLLRRHVDVFPCSARSTCSFSNWVAAHLASQCLWLEFCLGVHFLVSGFQLRAFGTSCLYELTADWASPRTCGSAATLLSFCVIARLSELFRRDRKPLRVRGTENHWINRCIYHDLH